MRLELLVSTMFQKDRSLIDKMNVCSDAVVVNQCDKNRVEIFIKNGYRVLWIDTTERGLSKSRNMAIANATADICVIADDDMVYRSDYVSTITSAFSRINADIIGFKVCGIEKKFKDYSDKEDKINYLKSMKMASVELAFKRSSFTEKNILFDELIGAGTEFMMGEENAMLFQCLKKGLTVYYVPNEIADLHIGNSTWFTERNEKFFMGKGASFRAMNTPFTSLLIWQWAIRKRGLYKEKYSLLKVVRLMQQGKRLYLKRKRGKYDT